MSVLTEEHVKCVFDHTLILIVGYIQLDHVLHSTVVDDAYLEEASGVGHIVCHTVKDKFPGIDLNYKAINSLVVLYCMQASEIVESIHTNEPYVCSPIPAGLQKEDPLDILRSTLVAAKALSIVENTFIVLNMSLINDRIQSLSTMDDTVSVPNPEIYSGLMSDTEAPHY